MKKKNRFLWLLKYAKQSKKDLFLYCFIGLLMVVVWLILPLFISKQTLLLTGNSWEDLYHLAFLIFGIHFFYSFLKYFISYHAQKFITQTFRNLHVDMTKHFLDATYKIIQERHSGFYIDRMTNDTIDIADFFINVTDDLIDLFINIGSLFTIFLLNRILFLFYVYFLVLLFFIKKVKTKRYAEEEKKKRESVDELLQQNLEMIHGVSEIKLLNLKKVFRRRMDQRVQKFNRSLMNLGEVNRFFLFLSNNVRNIFRFLIISFSIYLILNGELTVSVALLALNYEGSIFELLDYSESLIQNIRIFELASERIMEILDEDICLQEHFGKEALLPSSSNTFSSSHLTFSYHEDTPILSDISFEILPNTTTALVGKSGSGKSTLFHLLSKLYTPLEGSITLFGQDLNKIKENDIRDMISVVSQSPFLFSMSILENLKLVNKHLTQKDIIDACKKAQIHDEIMKMPNGYYTMVQEGGANLSGGQKQRLALARALLRDTPILLLDEATSALDNETQKRVQKELSRLKNKTIITIAHRLSTIQEYNQIIVLKDGRIEGIGNHDTLLKNNSTYQTLYQIDKKSNYELNPKNWTVYK